MFGPPARGRRRGAGARRSTRPTRWRRARRSAGRSRHARRQRCFVRSARGMVDGGGADRFAASVGQRDHPGRHDRGFARHGARAPSRGGTSSTMACSGRAAAKRRDDRLDVACAWRTPIRAAARGRGRRRSATKPSRSAGSDGTTALGRGTRPDRCLYAIAIGGLAGERSFPVNSSYVTMPSEYRSLRGSAGSPRICSGARYCTVPVTVPACVWRPSAYARARPKSATFTTPSVVTSTFSGLMSRCTMPWRCACSSPRSVWRTTSAAWAGFEFAVDRCRRRAAREPAHVLHDHVVDAVDRAPVVDGHDVGVGQPRRCPRLPAEPVDERLVARERPMQHLDRDLTVEHGVAREVDLAHTTRRDAVHDVVAPVERDERMPCRTVERRRLSQTPGRDAAPPGPGKRSEGERVRRDSMVGRAANRGGSPK